MYAGSHGKENGRLMETAIIGFVEIPQELEDELQPEMIQGWRV